MSEDRNSNTVIGLAVGRLVAVFTTAVLICAVTLTVGISGAFAGSVSLGDLDAEDTAGDTAEEANSSELPLPKLPEPVDPTSDEIVSSTSLKSFLSDEEVEAMGDRAIERLEASIVNGYVRIPGGTQPNGSTVTFSPIALIALDCDVNGPRLHSPFNDRHLKLTEEWHPLSKGPFFIYATDEQKTGVCERVFAKLTSITAGSP